MGQYTNVLISVQSVASTGASATSTTSDYVIDTAHWYRFRVKAKPNGGKFTVKVYDQGAAKPLAADVDGSLVATFEDLILPAFGGEGMTTFGLAGAGFHGFFGGGFSIVHLMDVPFATSRTGPIAVITSSRAGLSVSASTVVPLKTMRVNFSSLRPRRAP